ncbi:hypothetical protein [Bacillus cereus]|nr:hypothetical protein [Bacillus cereus]
MNLNSMVNSALKEKEISKHSWALKSNNIAMKKWINPLLLIMKQVFLLI